MRVNSFINVNNVNKSLSLKKVTAVFSVPMEVLAAHQFRKMVVAAIKINYSCPEASPSCRQTIKIERQWMILKN